MPHTSAPRTPNVKTRMTTEPFPPRSAYPWHLASSSLWMAGMSLQGFLFTWLLVGVLETPPDQTGVARSLAEFPPLVILLIGGVLGDRFNGRSYLAVMHLLMCLPPLAVAMVFELGLLSYWWVVTFGVLMAGIQSLSDPVRQSTLARVARFDIQRAVTIMTIATSLVGIGGMYVGGQLERLGLATVLVVQSLTFLAGLVAVWRLPPLPGARSAQKPNIGAGLKAVLRIPLVRNAIGLNFLSSLFNAGAYIIVIPYIVKEIYQGDAETFALVLIVFTTGAIGSNVALLPFMPLRRPGRLFLILQLTRVAILYVIWLAPTLTLFYAILIVWGINQGMTTTLARAMVQELAPPEEGARILSVLILSFMVSAPVSAILLGVLVERFDPMAGLLPGMAISLVIFGIGVIKSGLWSYRSTGNVPRGNSG